MLRALLFPMPLAFVFTLEEDFGKFLALFCGQAL